ncbi:hypothetical protein Tco_1364732 [Tanacetum coccineum]
MQTQESKVVSSKAVDVDLVVMESSGTESGKQDTSSSSGNYLTHVVDADIRPVNDQVPFAEVQLTAQHNVLANEQHHTEQSEPIYDTYLLEKVDSNTTPDLTNMCHRGGEIDQDAKQYQVKSPLLNAEFFKTKDMVEKEVYNELSNRFLQLEKHCISLEISIQQKEESFQSNKPCKNQDSPEFCEFFEINELKAQLQAKNSTINNLKKQIKNVHEKSNEAKVKHDIDVIETINIELEHKVAKLLKENETLKKHYKDLYDSIKVTRTKTIEQTTSLIAKNDEFKAQLQEKGFTIAALKNELRKLTGNSVNTKFAKPSILGKPVLQPPRNQSVVRQPNAFKSERPNFSKPRFASQVDMKNDLPKPVTPYYFPKVRESVFVKPHHVIASGSSRNSSKELYRSNAIAYNYYLEEAKKKTQDKNTNLKPRVMHTTSLQNTTNSSKPNPRSINQISRSLHVSKSICEYQMFLKEVNYRANVQSPKTRNNNKPVEQKSHTHKLGRQIAIGQRIFKTAGLMWIPTGKMFADSPTKVDSKPPNGSNEDITNPYECDQILNVSPGTLNLSADQALLFNDKMTSVHISSGLALQQKNDASLFNDKMTYAHISSSHMASADNTSGPVPQSKERCKLQCALSLEEEKSSCL